MPFPPSPTPDQQYTTALGTTYSHSADRTAWIIVSSGGGGTGEAIIGSGTVDTLPVFIDTTVVANSVITQALGCGVDNRVDINAKIFGISLDATEIHTPFYSSDNPLNVGVYFDNTAFDPLDTTSHYIRGEQYMDEGGLAEGGNVVIGTTRDFRVRDSDGSVNFSVTNNQGMWDPDGTPRSFTHIDGWQGIGFTSNFAYAPLSILGSNKKGIYTFDGRIQLSSDTIDMNKWNEFWISADQSPSAPVPGQGWAVTLFFDGTDVKARRDDGKTSLLSTSWS
jgi:hypothetical protein